MTLSVEFGRFRKDQSVKVYIRVEHRGARFRVDSNVVLTKSEYYIGKNKYKIRNISKHEEVESRVSNLRKKIIAEYGDTLVAANELNLSVLFGPKRSEQATLPQKEKLKTNLDKFVLSVDATDDQSSFHDFFEFYDDWYERCTAKGKKNYQAGMNKFKAFVDRDTLSFADLTPALLIDFQNSLKDLPRAQSLYMGNLRHLWKEAEKWYNGDLPRNPFDLIDVAKQKAVGQRAVDVDAIMKVYNYKPQYETDELARDCYLLSFCFMGMNSADLFNCPPIKNGILAYDRTKVKDRRRDKGHTELTATNIGKAPRKRTLVMSSCSIQDYELLVID